MNPIGPRSCHDEGKRCAETLFFDYQRQHNLNIKVARLFNTYGPRMQPDDGRVVSNFIMQALNGEAFTVYGDGSQTRSFCYVDDTVDALIRLMATGHGVAGPINIGNPHEISVRELAEPITSLVDPSNEVDFMPLPVDDPHRRQPDISRARAILGWEPSVSLADGLAHTVTWFKGAYGTTPAAGRASDPGRTSTVHTARPSHDSPHVCPHSAIRHVRVGRLPHSGPPPRHGDR